ncbi:MAG: hypothetical protein IJC24_04410 [Clostridia bacterium]|nr:hypothetical protein [Clostridia bacterium]
MGRLAELHKEYAGTGVQFLGMAADVISWKNDVGQEAADYVDSTGAKYPQIGATVELISGISYIPSTHVYDSSGTLIAKVVGDHSRQDWINIIETLMADR